MLLAYDFATKVQTHVPEEEHKTINQRKNIGNNDLRLLLHALLLYMPEPKFPSRATCVIIVKECSRLYFLYENT